MACLRARRIGFACAFSSGVGISHGGTGVSPNFCSGGLVDFGFLSFLDELLIKCFSHLRKGMICACGPSLRRTKHSPEMLWCSFASPKDYLLVILLCQEHDIPRSCHNK